MDHKRPNPEENVVKPNIFSLEKVGPQEPQDESKDSSTGTSGRWTTEEHYKFIEGIVFHAIF